MHHSVERQVCNHTMLLMKRRARFLAAIADASAASRRSVMESGQHDSLFACQKFQLAYEILDDLIPEKLLRSATTGAANALLLLRVAAHIQQVANNLIGIISLRNDSVLKGDSIIFAGAHRNRN